HTFGQANNPGPASGRYDWLVHLDREPVSAAEVLHASGCQPHQLTQRFLLGDGSTPGQRFQHYAPWFDQTRRLYRAFAFFTTPGRGGGAPNEPGGRVAGKVNLNAVWDAETFLALCDPSSANGPNLTRDNVLAIYQQMLALRTPGQAGGGGPGPGDRPVLGPGTGRWQAVALASPAGRRPGPGGGQRDTL